MPEIKSTYIIKKIENVYCDNDDCNNGEHAPKLVWHNTRYRGILDSEIYTYRCPSCGTLYDFDNKYPMEKDENYDIKAKIVEINERLTQVESLI